ncbi:serine/threonine-protein kinase, partial [Actinoplanes sp. NPDC049596]
MSVVWRASDEVLGRDVAVKVLAAQLAADAEVLRRLRDEARAAAGLRHPNVVEVYDYGESASRPYVVMELVDGRSLADLVAGGPLPWKPAVVIGAQVAAALAAAHARGVVHRDVKPANVMVTAAGAKLVDFGISATVGAVDGQDGRVLGTPAYLAPERIAGGPVRPASDVYALGLLLYLVLAGRAPWPASTVTQMLRAHVYAEPDPLPPVPGMPAVVSRLVRRCLAKGPGDRPSAAEVADRLGELAGLPPAKLLHVPETAEIGTSLAAGPTVAQRRRPVLPAGHRRVVVGALAALGL